MENNLETSNNFKNKLLIFLKENKFKLLFILLLLIAFLIVTIFYNLSQKKK